MITLNMKNYYTILTEKQEKKHYHLEKLININILQVKKYHLPIKKVIEQANFTHSSSEKALEKQVKTIEDQEEKQIKALEKHGKELIMSSGKKDSLQLLKQKEMFDELVNERRLEVNKLSERTDFNNLTYHYKGK